MTVRCQGCLPPSTGEMASAPAFMLAYLLGSKRPCPDDAIWRDRLGRALCDDCAQRAKVAHENGETILSMIHPGTPFPLDPIQ